MPWTEDVPLFKQTVFEFDESDLSNADKWAAAIAEMIIQEKSSPSVALGTFVILLADFIAANVDIERWGEGLNAVGLLVNAALARVAHESGLVKIGSKHHH